MRKTLGHEPAIGFLGNAEDNFHVHHLAERCTGNNPTFDRHRK
jgi:hypothetical protein